MSTETRKSTASTPQEQSAESTSSQGRDSNKSTSFSPARVSRLEEKIQLQNLNDRLATYIDKVRFLETENSRLTGQVITIQETCKTEMRESKEQYLSEISSLRIALDKASKEKAQVLIESNNIKNSINDLQTKLQKKEKDLFSTENNLIKLENKNTDLENTLNKVRSDYKKLEDSYKEADQERKSLTDMLNEIREKCDASILRITDLENKLQSMKEEMNFKETVYEKELSNSRLLKTVEISGIDASLREDYDQKLADSLRKLREQYENQMMTSKIELEEMYQKQMEDLSRSCISKIKVTQEKEEETRNMKTRVEFLSSKVTELESLNENLKSRIKDLELMLEQEREWNAMRLNEKDEEIKKLREESQIQLTEYQDLLCIKVALDMEIGAYRKLLEGEEERLNISHEQSSFGETPGRKTAMRHNLSSSKRKRAHFELWKKSSRDAQVTASVKSDVEISDYDDEGNFIKLHNKGNTEVPLKGWQLVRKAGDQEIIYNFKRYCLIKPDSYITVWSSDSNATHVSPNDYVMKSQRWIIAENMSSVLLNNNGEEMAIRETRTKVNRSSEEIVLSSGLYPPEDMQHQQGDLDRERCALM